METIRRAPRFVGKFIEAAVAEVEKCSGCSAVETAETNATQVQSQIPSETVNDIRTNPEINSVLSGYDPVAATVAVPYEWS